MLVTVLTKIHLINYMTLINLTKIYKMQMGLLVNLDQPQQKQEIQD